MGHTMKLFGRISRKARLAPAILAVCLAIMPTAVFGWDEPKVSMEDVLKELTSMRRELREMKIQRSRDQRAIEDLRRIVENTVPPAPEEGSRPAVARAPEDRQPKTTPAPTPASGN